MDIYNGKPQTNHYKFFYSSAVIFLTYKRTIAMKLISTIFLLVFCDLQTFIKFSFLLYFSYELYCVLNVLIFMIINNTCYYSTVTSFYLTREKEHAKYPSVVDCHITP